MFVSPQTPPTCTKSRFGRRNSRLKNRFLPVKMWGQADMSTAARDETLSDVAAGGQDLLIRTTGYKLSVEAPWLLLSSKILVFQISSWNAFLKQGPRPVLTFWLIKQDNFSYPKSCFSLSIICICIWPKNNNNKPWILQYTPQCLCTTCYFSAKTSLSLGPCR